MPDCFNPPGECDPDPEVLKWIYRDSSDVTNVSVLNVFILKPVPWTQGIPPPPTFGVCWLLHGARGFLCTLPFVIFWTF